MIMMMMVMMMIDIYNYINFNYFISTALFHVRHAQLCRTIHI